MRPERATVLMRAVAPVAGASVAPGGIVVVRARSSWQPPQMRDSPGRPENHTGSLNSDMPNLSTAWRWIGMFDGILADHDLSGLIGATPRLAWPSNIVLPNISGKPSSDEKPSITRTP